jgi:glutamyl-tRNA synthetase
MGGVRTALYNWLFARRHGGTFILRVEDTDRTRFVEGAEAYILEALDWCGITPDEGPFRQSDRQALYGPHVEQLLNSGWAYLAWDTQEEISAVREAASAKGETWQYDASTRLSMRNALSLTSAEISALVQAGTPSVVRFKVPADRIIDFTDAIRGGVSIATSVMDDKVLMKADGMPTYHMANIVDDHLMEITHVIRGEEWLPSAALHVLLYEALGWDAPVFAHLPLILKPSGPGKLSKRDGDQGGFPIFPLEWTDPSSGAISAGYRERDYLPEAFMNMLLMLGWNPGTEQEIFTLDEAASCFSLDRVIKSGARFNPEKACWFNEQHLRSLPPAKLVAPLQSLMAGRVDWDDADCLRVLGMMLERVTFLSEIAAASWLFTPPTNFDAKLVRKKWKEQTPEILGKVSEVLQAAEPFEAGVIEADFKAFLEAEGLGFGAALLPLRIVLTGLGGGPSMFDFAEFLGRKATLERVASGVELVEKLKAEA